MRELVSALAEARIGETFNQYADGAILVATAGTTRKARNARERPDGSILIDARGGASLRGAAATRRMGIVTGGAAARELNERVWGKYLTATGIAAPDVGGAIRAHDDVTIRFTPRRWRTWGTETDFGGAFEAAGMTFPLDR
jgi:hypothetical protein